MTENNGNTPEKPIAQTRRYMDAATFDQLVAKLSKLDNEGIRKLLAAASGIMAQRRGMLVSTMLRQLAEQAARIEAGEAGELDADILGT